MSTVVDTMTGTHREESHTVSQYFARTPEPARQISPLRRSDPKSVGDYGLLGVLGRGGMGTVYLGQSRDGKRVAIKVIRADLAEDPTFRRRFAREVAIAAGVNAFYTAALVEADPDGARPWFATAYIEGPSLAALVKNHGPLAPQTVFTLAAGVAEALAGMHGVGLVHRDLKPANVLLTDGGPYVIDFGIALPANATRLTTGLALGTPMFMAPERVDGGHESSAGDIFSLGATLVYASTGHGIVRNDMVAAQLIQLVRGRFDLTGVPGALLPLVNRCLARNPRDRPTAPEIVRALVGSGVIAPGPGWFGAAWPTDSGAGIRGISRTNRLSWLLAAILRRLRWW
jgi:serine/threonine protein kinase